jgi:hypothetical protein
MALSRAAEPALLAGSYPRAGSLVVEVLGLLRDQASPRWVADALEMAALVLEAQRDGEGATAVLRAADALRKASGEQPGGARVLALEVQRGRERLLGTSDTLDRPEVAPSPDVAIDRAVEELCRADLMTEPLRCRFGRPDTVDHCVRAGRSGLQRHRDRRDLHSATGGILVSSLVAERPAKEYPQRALIIAGFVVTLAGIVVLLALAKGSPSAVAFAPGLLLTFLGVGAMLARPSTSCNRAFPEERQGEISGLWRSVSSSDRASARRSRPHPLAGLTDHASGLAMVALAVIGCDRTRRSPVPAKPSCGCGRLRICPVMPTRSWSPLPTSSGSISHQPLCHLGRSPGSPWTAAGETMEG